MTDTNIVGDVIEIPAAFPVAMSEQTVGNQKSEPYQAGMTLLDYFAAHAPIALSDAFQYWKDRGERGVTNEQVINTLVSMRLTYAERMLKMRRS